jgi:hypothetical protein
MAVAAKSALEDLGRFECERLSSGHVETGWTAKRPGLDDLEGLLSGKLAVSPLDWE